MPAHVHLLAMSCHGTILLTEEYSAQQAQVQAHLLEEEKLERSDTAPKYCLGNRPVHDLDWRLIPIVAGIFAKLDGLPPEQYRSVGLRHEEQDAHFEHSCPDDQDPERPPPICVLIDKASYHRPNLHNVSLKS
jgi:hypothetical protein